MKIASLLTLLMLAACGGDKADDNASAFDGLHEPIDKAEDVERQVLEQKERMDEALEAAERDVEPEGR
jgi:hypothetical protein